MSQHGELHGWTKLGTVSGRASGRLRQYVAAGSQIHTLARTLASRPSSSRVSISRYLDLQA